MFDTSGALSRWYGNSDDSIDAGCNGDGNCDDIHVGFDVNCNCDEVVAVMFIDDLFAMLFVSSTGSIYTDVCLFINTGDLSESVVVGAVVSAVVDTSIWCMWQWVLRFMTRWLSVFMKVFILGIHRHWRRLWPWYNWRSYW